ncbi:MAG: hypothetical protein Q9219_007422 [cf. Caloplaca sp. 3 TL-2023]
MAQQVEQSIHRDSALFYWILFPITIVMILTGVLRHYATVLLMSPPKKQDSAAIREQRSLLRGINLRNNAYSISSSAFAARKNYMTVAYKEGAFLKDAENRGKPAPNPMTDPAAMEGMMGMMKGNMAMMVPQTLIMGWINAFFAGYVIMKLPFPLTLRFKSMLQSGVATRDLDVRPFSSSSLEMRTVTANQMAQQMSQMNTSASAGLFQPGQDPDKVFRNEAENLEVFEHEYILKGVEQRLLNM